MSDILLKNAAVAGVDGDVNVLVEDGIVASVGEASAGGSEQIDCGGLTLLPGFVDIHIHGASGVDVNEADVDGLLRVAEFLAGQGVTAWVPTLVPDSDENYARAVAEIDRLMEIQQERPIAQAVGIHYEGIFANEKMCGALRPEYFKRFTGDELASVPRLQSGIHLTTFAPEIEGGVELARELTRLKWVASIGHTRADVETLDRAADAGAKHVTHFFNAMTGIHHRDIGVAGWALTRPDVTFDIIADGLHVNPRMLEMACRAKTPEKTLLISDSVAPTGLGDGVFQLWDENVEVVAGRTRNERGSIAGSVISMFDAFKGMRSIGFSTYETSLMASANPARLLGLTSRGAIVAGKRADIVALDGEGSIAFVMIGGTMVG